MRSDLMWQIIGAVPPWILLVGVFSILATAFRVFLVPKLKGHLGEASVNFWAKRRLDQGVYHLIADVTLPTPEGTTQIDHVIVSQFGIFVIETKMYKGWIYGDERQAQWTQVIFKRKERFQNPLRQNYRHTKTLSELTGIPHDYFKSLVVFVGDSTFKTEMPANVVRGRGWWRQSEKGPLRQSEKGPPDAGLNVVEARVGSKPSVVGLGPRVLRGAAPPFRAAHTPSRPGARPRRSRGARRARAEGRDGVCAVVFM